MARVAFTRFELFLPDTWSSDGGSGAACSQPPGSLPWGPHCVSWPHAPLARAETLSLDMAHASGGLSGGARDPCTQHLATGSPLTLIPKSLWRPRY